MIQTSRPPGPDRGGSDPALEVDVARTGGIAGMTRRWSAQPPPAEASAWLSLIDRCPWDEAAAPAAPESVAGEADDARAADPQPRAPVPDGFVWLIRASWAGSDPREAELFDDQVVGAWRELVDAVRDWSTQRPPPERPGR